MNTTHKIETNEIMIARYNSKLLRIIDSCKSLVQLDQAKSAVEVATNTLRRLTKRYEDNFYKIEMMRKECLHLILDRTHEIEVL